MPATIHEGSPFRLADEPTPVELLAKYFRAYADPTRLQILELVAERERSVGELARLTGEAQPKISNHLACLRWCGFVTTRRDHRLVFYSVADPRVIELLELARGLLADNAEHVSCCRTIATGKQ
jgi:ArsR family transcriptional regulator, cadmium/lead-responsive transcriptional repressor